MRSRTATVVAAAALSCAVAILSRPEASAQRRGGPPPVPQPARTVAPIDPTGYWVSVVTEDWRWRMVTPLKGDYVSVPINADGRRVADTWDIAKDDAAGNQCKAFGVAGLTRQPGRLHVTWQDDNTLKVDFDAGTQTRLLHFDKSAAPPDGPRTWQGYSVAEWEGRTAPDPSRGRGNINDARLISPEEARRRGTGTGFGSVPGGGGQGLRGGPPLKTAGVDSGAVKVVTTNFREGYLRKNGVPYSEDAQITEYFQWLPPHPSGDRWLIVTTAVDDPKYLAQPFYTSTNFKRESDGSKWNPTPCKTDPPGQPTRK
jgi:hypothetical protein